MLEQWLHFFDGHFAEGYTGSLAGRVKGNFSGRFNCQISLHLSRS